MDKIKVGIELTDSWNRGDFREFVISLLKDDRYDVYIISNDDSSAYVTKIGETLKMPTTNIYIVNFTQDKVQTIIDLDLDIYLENLNYVADLIENTTDCYGIYVSSLPNIYKVQPKYIVAFERLVNDINGENCGELEAKED